MSENPSEKYLRPREKKTIPHLSCGLCGLFLIATLVVFLFRDLTKDRHKPQLCESSKEVLFGAELKFSINKVSPAKGRKDCFHFLAESGQTIRINSSTQFEFIDSNNRKISKINGSYSKQLNRSGEYTIRVHGKRLPSTYSIKGTLETKSVPSTISESAFSPSQVTDNIPATPSDNVQDKSSDNNHSNYVLFSNSDYQLQKLVESSVKQAQIKDLPSDKLSIVLIDLNNPGVGVHRSSEPRFPASIVKLFWLVALFKYYESDYLSPNEVSEQDLKRLMQDSDNNAASKILDILTDTRSSKEELSPTDLDAWILRRKSINNFFENIGYVDINISQKNFPIPDLSLALPQGPDLQIRGSQEYPERNFLTAESVARLLLEIEQEKAVSSFYSQKAKQLMKRDFVAEQAKQYDSIIGFLGEGLNPDEIELFSKPGWTSDSRQDAAIVYSKDNSVRYILVVMANDSLYAKDEDFFPTISELIYSQMKNLSLANGL